MTGSEPPGREVPGEGLLRKRIEALSAGARETAWQRTRFRLDRSLSAGYLGIGFALFGSLLVVRGLGSLSWSWSGTPWRLLSVAAWILLLAVLGLSLVLIRRRGGLLPARFSTLIDVAGATAVLLDMLALLAAPGEPYYPTATVGFGACLLVCLPAQPLSRSAWGAGVLAASGAATALVGWATGLGGVGVGLNNLMVALAPVVGCILMLSATDARLSHLIDQAVADSVVPTTPSGHGVVAASTLQRLDADAERLLAGVAESPADSPIDPATAALAGVLGDELRQALRADHELSWLQIAVGESEHLRSAIALTDADGSAQELGPEQRSTLLALLWLLAASRSTPAARVEVMLAGSPLGDPGALEITTSWSGRSVTAIDNAVWPLFTSLGRYTVEVHRERIAVAVHLGAAAAPSLR